MRAAVECRVSIVSLFLSLLLPLLFSVLAVYIRKPKLLLVICFLKASLFAFTSCQIMMAYSGAGWLVRLLFLFSDICMVPAHYWYWSRHVGGEGLGDWSDAAACAAYAVFIGSTDYCLVAPFLAQLISN